MNDETTRSFKVTIAAPSVKTISYRTVTEDVLGSTEEKLQWGTVTVYNERVGG